MFHEAYNLDWQYDANSSGHCRTFSYPPASTTYSIRSILYLHPLPLSCTFLSSDEKATLKIAAILSQSCGLSGLFCATSLASARSYSTPGQRNGGITKIFTQMSPLHRKQHSKIILICCKHELCFQYVSSVEVLPNWHFVFFQLSTNELILKSSVKLQNHLLLLKLS